MLLLNHKTRYADVRIRRDVVQMYFQCSKSLLCSKGLVVLCCCRGSWSVNLSVLAVNSNTMTEKMGLVLFRSVSGLVMMFATVFLLQDHGCAS